MWIDRLQTWIEIENLSEWRRTLDINGIHAHLLSTLVTFELGITWLCGVYVHESYVSPYSSLLVLLLATWADKETPGRPLKFAE